MPIVKQISIHKTPLKMIQYILNGDKNSDMKFATGINCSANVNDAYKEFKEIFEHYTGERFYKYCTNDDAAKEKIRLHHYIQSFLPGEVTPEEAHQIGLEWAKKTFGENRQVIVSTHIDKGHIHNHFAVAAIGIDGEVWHSNKKSLTRCRAISDKIAMEHGLSIIEHTSKIAISKKYTEWLAEQKQSSWKTKLRNDVDKLIVSNEVNSIDDLLDKLREMNYTVTQNKYISIKAPNQKKAMRSFRLGDGYSLEDLQYRIDNKQKESTLYSIFQKYSGIQVEYALCIRKLQIAAFQKKPEIAKVSYYTLRKNADMLLYMSNNNIHSIRDFEYLVNKASEQYFETKKKCDDIASEIKKEKSLVEDIKDYHNLCNKEFLSPEEKMRFKKVNYVGLKNISADSAFEHMTIVKKLEEQLTWQERNLDVAKSKSDEARNVYNAYITQTTGDYAELIDRIREERQQAEIIKSEQDHQEQYQVRTADIEKERG